MLKCGHLWLKEKYGPEITVAGRMSYLLTEVKWLYGNKNADSRDNILPQSGQKHSQQYSYVNLFIIWERIHNLGKAFLCLFLFFQKNSSMTQSSA